MVTQFPASDILASHSDDRPASMYPYGLLVLLAAMALIAGVPGCSSSSSSSTSTTSTLAITSLTPTSGTVGTAVTISGSSFGATQASNSTVTFNGTAATPLSWNATSIVVDVPKGATTGNVVVTAAGTPSAGSSFTVNTGAVTPCTGTLGSESILNGTYAYSMTGFSGLSPGTAFVRAGSFVANGTGLISSGQEDFNFGANGDDLHTVTSGTYSVGADNRGCMTLTYNDSATVTYRFSLGTIGGVSANIASRGNIIEFDDTNGLGRRASGTILQQSTGAFSGSNLQTHYAFGLQGTNSTGGQVSEAGTFTLAPNTAPNNLTAGYFDFNNAGTQVFSGGTNGASAGTLNTSGAGISTTTGRTTGTFIAQSGCAATCTYHWAVYIVNQYQFFIVSTDTLGANTPLVVGRAAAASIGYVGSYLSTASTNGGYIIAGSGATAGAANAELEQLSFTATNVSGTQWTYASGAGAQTTVASAAVTPSAVGRFTFGNVVLYLTNPTASDGIAAFVLSTDLTTTGGIMVGQQSFGFSPTGNGRFFFGSVVMADANARNQIGVGATVVPSSGTNVAFGGATDQNAATAANVLASSGFLDNFTVSSSNGAATASDGNGGTIVGIANGNSMFYIDESGDAAVTWVEQ
jgi:IPT/TIG domain-containing protein